MRRSCKDNPILVSVTGQRTSQADIIRGGGRVFFIE